MYSFFDFNFGDVAIAHLLPHYTPEEMPEISPRRLEPHRPSQENLLSGFAPGIGVRLRIKESWLAGFEEGRKYPLKESK